jgi:hypothetical protein
LRLFEQRGQHADRNTQSQDNDQKAACTPSQPQGTTTATTATTKPVAAGTLMLTIPIIIIFIKVTLLWWHGIGS